MEKQRKPSQRVARRRQRLREQILESSSVLFAKAGLDGVRFEDIANAADIARGTLYSFFRDKESLLEELGSEVSGRLLQGIERIKQTEPVARIEEIFHLYCDLWEKMPERMLLLQKFLEQNKLQGKEQYQSFKQRLQEAFASARDRLRSKDPALSAELFSQTSVPSLETLSRYQNYRQLFVDHFRAFLLQSP